MKKEARIAFFAAAAFAVVAAGAHAQQARDADSDPFAPVPFSDRQRPIEPERSETDGQTTAPRPSNQPPPQQESKPLGDVENDEPTTIEDFDIDAFFERTSKLRTGDPSERNEPSEPSRRKPPTADQPSRKEITTSKPRPEPRGPLPQDRSLEREDDSIVAEEVLRRLRENPETRSQLVAVAVENGTAYVKGTVRNSVDRSRILAVIKTTPGVREVVDRIDRR
jgi:hypothetical protein